MQPNVSLSSLIVDIRQSHLQEVLPHEVSLLGRLRLGIHPVQREARVARNVEPRDGERVHLLLALRLG